MERLKILLNQFEFHLLLFLAGLVLFTQPLLIMASNGSPDSVLLSLFLPWAAIIVLLFLASRSYRSRAAEHEESQDGGEW